MGAMPGNRERKDCQTDLEGVRENGRKQTKWEMVHDQKEIVKTDHSMRIKQTRKKTSVKVRGVQSEKSLQVEEY